MTNVWKSVQRGQRAQSGHIFKLLKVFRVVKVAKLTKVVKVATVGSGSQYVLRKGEGQFQHTKSEERGTLNVLLFYNISTHPNQGVVVLNAPPPPSLPPPSEAG